MNKLARYHLVLTIVMALVTLTVAVFAVRQWFTTGRPPIYTMWPQHAVLAAGGYRTYYHFKAFRKALGK